MIGMVLVTHGALAEEFRAALEHVVGAQENLATICIGPDDDMEKRREDIVDAIVNVDKGKGVALLTDMFGGTPCNLAIGASQSDSVEVIYGANLPMLVKLAKCRDRSLAEASRCAVEAGVKYIDCASNMLKADAC